MPLKVEQNSTFLNKMSYGDSGTRPKELTSRGRDKDFTY